MTDTLTNLIWDLRELAFEGFSRGWDGLDQRDKHAEINRVIDAIKQEMPGDELGGLLQRANADERRILAYIARRALGIGKKNYPPTNIATDSRDFQKEGADELADFLWYAAMQEVRVADQKRLDGSTVASFDVSDVGEVLEVLK